MFNPLSTGFFSVFLMESVSVSNIMGKRMNGFSWKFSVKFAHKTRNKLEHFGDVVINPLNPGSIVLLPRSVFVSNVMEKTRERIFMKFSRNVSHDASNDGWVDITEIFRIWTQVAID